MKRSLLNYQVFRVVYSMRRLITCAVFFLLFFEGGRAHTFVVVKQAGTLGTLLTQVQQDTCTALAIKGKLNSADIRVLRRMAGYGTEGRPGRLAVLDLHKARFVKDSEPFMVLDASECRLAGTAIPDRYIANISSASPDLRNGNDQAFFLYKPKFLLGYSRDEAVTEHTIPSVDFDYNAYSPWLVNRESDGDFRFAMGITDAQWQKMEEYGVTSFKGHQIMRENGHYMLYVCLQKDIFPADMFYGCSSLQEIVLPRKVKMNFSVMDEPARYRIIRMGK